MSVHYECAAAIKAVIEGLIAAGSLTGIVTDEVTIRWRDRDRREMYPGINILPGKIRDARGTTICDDHVYACLLVIRETDNQDLTSVINTLENRQAIRRAFNNKKLSAVDENYIVKIVEGDAVDLDELLRDYEDSVMSIDCYCREGRS